MISIKSVKVTYSPWIPKDNLSLWIPRKITAVCGCHIFVSGPFMLEVTMRRCNI